MTVSGITNSTTATERGTKIIKNNGEMDKNAFLTILTAQLSNQDPSNAQDSSQYVSQLAQFSSLEQMSNLNNTMLMSSANALIGKAVALNVLDDNGEALTGVVKSVTRSGSEIKLNVETLNNGVSEIGQYSYSNITDVTEVPDYTMQSMGENMMLLTSSALIGKKAEFSTTDENGNGYVGTVKSVYINGSSINFNVELDNGETVDLPYSALKKVSSI